MFKIFVQSGGQGVKYYCGKKVIKPSSKVNHKSYSEHFILVINLKDRTWEHFYWFVGSEKYHVYMAYWCVLLM